MKKFTILGMALLFLTACGAGRTLVLPEAENISCVTVSSGSIQTVIDEERHITELLQAMGQARDTGHVSIQDRPEKMGDIQVDFHFRQGGVSTLFLYPEGDQVILEQPFERIYVTDNRVLDCLRLYRLRS